MKPFRIRALLLASLFALLPAPAAAVDVTADDSADVYAISGAILLNATFAEAREASACPDCQWRILRVCAHGTLEDRANCMGTPCPSAADIAEVWRAIAPVPPPVGDPAWEYRGLMCLSEQPRAMGEVQSSLLEGAQRALPALRPTSQPAAKTLTALPTWFASGQPAEFVSAPASVAGESVVIRARPVWTWDFGHGNPVITTDPGAPYPRGVIRHTYPRRGLYRVRVTTTWTAVYDLRGISDLPIAQPITQTAWFDLRVMEARRFLQDKGH